MSTELDMSFAEVVSLIQTARHRAYKAVNKVLVDLYWQVGEYVSRRIDTGTWGEGTVDQLAAYITKHHPEMRGFTRRNLYRMRQFYETYHGNEKLSTLSRELSWTHNMIILSKCTRPEERKFYLRLAKLETWNKRRLEHEIDSALFERQTLSSVIVSPMVAQLHPNLPRKCLVRKEHEKPSVGVLLCKSKDSEVVKYALSRSLSPAVVAQYHTQLPDKALLQQKLHEFYELEFARQEKNH